MSDRSPECSEAPLFSVSIIGAGPVGLFAASMCRMLGLHTIVFDTLPQVGGQCAILYPEKHVQGIPAFDELTSQELVQRLYQQALSCQTEFKLNTKIDQIHLKTESEKSLFELHSQSGDVVSQAVIIAAGMGSFEPNRPVIARLEEFEGSSIYYHVADTNQFKDSDVVIAGGGDSAVDWAVELSSIAKSVTIVHRRNKFRCTPSNEERLQKLIQKNQVKIYTPYQLTQLNGENQQLSSILIQNAELDTVEIPTDKLLILFGISANLGPIQNWGLALKGQKIIINNSTCATNIPGIFAVGDAVDYDYKINLITCGFGEAIKAAYAVKRYLDPERTLSPNCQAFNQTK